MSELKEKLLSILRSCLDLRDIARERSREPMWTELKELSDKTIRNKDPRWPK